MFASHFDTPFGNMDLSFAPGRRAVLSKPTPRQRSFPDVKLLRWSSTHLDVTLFLVALSPELPPGMVVAHCHIAIWRVRAHTNVDACIFEARWARTARPPDGGPSSGQRLNALTWSDDSIELSLGAPDAEGVFAYPRAGIELPAAWTELLSADDPASVNIEEYLADGLRLSLPGLRPQETATMHFVVAWADAVKHEAAPWFAADLATAVIRSCLDRISNER